MSGDIKANEHEIAIARFGMNIQAEAHGLDMTDPAIVAFVEHVSQVIAAHNAMETHIRRALHPV